MWFPQSSPHDLSKLRSSKTHESPASNLIATSRLEVTLFPRGFANITQASICSQRSPHNSCNTSQSLYFFQSSLETQPRRSLVANPTANTFLKARDPQPLCLRSPILPRTSKPLPNVIKRAQRYTALSSRLAHAVAAQRTMPA